MIQTREDIIELRYKVAAVLRKAQCRAVNCDIIDSLYSIEQQLQNLDNQMTEIIGD